MQQVLLAQFPVFSRKKTQKILKIHPGGICRACLISKRTFREERNSSMLSMIGEAAYHVTPRPGTGRSVWASARAPKGKFVCVSSVRCVVEIPGPNLSHHRIKKWNNGTYIDFSLVFPNHPNKNSQVFEPPNSWGLGLSRVLFTPPEVFGAFWKTKGGFWRIYVEFSCVFSRQVSTWPVKTWKHWILWLYCAFLLVGESGLPTTVASFPLHQQTNQLFVGWK